MYKPGHQGVVLLFTVWSVPLALITGILAPILIVGTSLATCTLPDIDMELPVSHRGITHTVWFGLAVSVAALAFGVVLDRILTNPTVLTSILPETISGYQTIRTGYLLDHLLTTTIGLGTMLGFTSHLFGDAITVGSGEYAVKPFMPISDKPFRFGICKASSPVWNYGLLGTGLFIQSVTWYLTLSIIS